MKGRGCPDDAEFDLNNGDPRARIWVYSMSTRRDQRIVERFTRLDEGTIEYRATVEDARAFTRPWTVVVPLLKDDDYVLYEYACHEGNRGFEQILRAHQATGRQD